MVHCRIFVTDSEVRTRGGGVLPEKLGGGVRPASQNPYPISDLSYNQFPSSDQC